MDLEKLYEILGKTTVMLRKGPELLADGKEISGDEFKQRMEDNVGGVYEAFNMPPESAAREDLEKVDCHFVTIGVDKIKAEENRAKLLEILKTWEPGIERLKAGPSYIETGAIVGSQDGALQLYGLGQALGWWEVITPKRLGFEGAEADKMAGGGFVMIAPKKEFSLTAWVDSHAKLC